MSNTVSSLFGLLAIALVVAIGPGSKAHAAALHPTQGTPAIGNPVIDVRGCHRPQRKGSGDQPGKPQHRQMAT